VFVFSAIDDVNSRVSTLRLLVALLPTVNRDTLWYLLTFLGCVAKHSADQLDDTGHSVSLQIQHIFAAYRGRRCVLKNYNYYHHHYYNYHYYYYYYYCTSDFCLTSQSGVTPG